MAGYVFHGNYYMHLRSFKWRSWRSTVFVGGTESPSANADVLLFISTFDFCFDQKNGIQFSFPAECVLRPSYVRSTLFAWHYKYASYWKMLFEFHSEQATGYTLAFIKSVERKWANSQYTFYLLLFAVVYCQFTWIFLRIAFDWRRQRLPAMNRRCTHIYHIYNKSMAIIVNLLEHTESMLFASIQIYLLNKYGETQPHSHFVPMYTQIDWVTNSLVMSN